MDLVAIRFTINLLKHTLSDIVPSYNSAAHASEYSSPHFRSVCSDAKLSDLERSVFCGSSSAVTLMPCLTLQYAMKLLVASISSLHVYLYHHL